MSGIWIGALLGVTFVADVPAQQTGWTVAEEQVAACFTAMDREPALAVVNAKFVRRNPKEAQLADPVAATEQESAALRERVRKTRPCRELRLAAVRSFHPHLEPAYATLYYQADQVFAYLIDGWISFGTANRLSEESLSLFEARSKAYFAADEAERQALANVWDETLQRAHSNPPPDRLRSSCEWQDLNIVCD